MKNDLDVNISNGEFRFAAKDHDHFIALLRRSPSKDADGFLAYSYENWTFWINGDKDYCKFYMRLTASTDGANKTDAGNDSYGICRVIDASCSPSPDPRSLGD